MNQPDNSSVLRDACRNYRDAKNLAVLRLNVLARLIVGQVCKKLNSFNNMGVFYPIKEYAEIQPLAIELDQLSNDAFVDLLFEDNTGGTISLPAPNKNDKVQFTKEEVVKLANLRKSYTEEPKHTDGRVIYGDPVYLILNLQTSEILMIEDEVKHLLMSAVPKDFDMEWSVSYSTQAFSRKVKGKNGDKDHVETHLQQGFRIIMECN